MPIVHAAEADAQLVNPLSQHVRFWAPQFVSELAQWFETDDTFRVCSRSRAPEMREPLADRSYSASLLIEDYRGARHGANVQAESITILLLRQGSAIDTARRRQDNQAEASSIRHTASQGG